MLAHLADLQSDFSAIHRIDDMYALDGPTFMRMAFRLPVYQGVLRQRLLLQDQDTTAPQHHQQATTTSVTRGEMTADQVEAMRNQARTHHNPQALQPGEQPRYVPINQLIRDAG